MSLKKVQSVVPAFKRAQAIVWKRGTGSGYGPFIPLFNINSQPFPKNDNGQVFYTAGENKHPGVMAPFWAHAPTGGNGQYFILYLPIKTINELTGEDLTNRGVSFSPPQWAGYNGHYYYQQGAVGSDGKPAMPKFGNPPFWSYRDYSETPRPFEQVNESFSLPNFTSTIHQKYREICDEYKGEVTNENYPEIFQLFERLYYFGYERFLNSGPAKPDGSGRYLGLPLSVLKQSMWVLYSQTWNYNAEYGGPITEYIFVSGAGSAAAIKDTTNHDKQIWILGPQFPQEIAFAPFYPSGGRYSRSSPLTYINSDGQEVTLPAANSGIVSLTTSFKPAQTLVENPDFVRAEEDFLIKGKKEFLNPVKVPRAVDNSDAVNLGQLNSIIAPKKGLNWKSLFIALNITSKTGNIHPLSKLFFVINPFLKNLDDLTMNDILVPIAFAEGNNAADETKTGNADAFDWGWVVLVEFSKFKKLLPNFDEAKYKQHGLNTGYNSIHNEFFNNFGPNGSYNKNDVIRYCERKFGDCALALPYTSTNQGNSIWYRFYSALCPTNPATSHYYAGMGGMGKPTNNASISEFRMEVFKVGNPEFNIYDITYSKCVTEYSNYNPYRFWEQADGSTINLIRVTKEDDSFDNIIASPTSFPNGIKIFGEIRSLKLTDKKITREQFFGNSANAETSNMVNIDKPQAILSEKTFEVLPSTTKIPSRKDHLVNKKYVDDEISEITGIEEPDWISYTFDFRTWNTPNRYHSLSNVFFITKKLYSISDFTIKDALVPLCFTAGNPNNNPRKTGINKDEVKLWGYVVLVTWEKYKDLMPHITASNYFNESMVWNKNQFLRDFWNKFSPSTQYSYSEIEDWCRETLRDCIVVEAHTDRIKSDWSQTHTQTYGAWNALLYNNRFNNYQVAGSGYIGPVGTEAHLVQFNLRKIGNPIFNIFDITYNANAWARNSHYPTEFQEGKVTYLARAAYRKESAPDTEVQVISGVYPIKSAEDKIHSFIYGDKTFPEDTFKIPLKPNFKESPYAKKYRPNTFTQINTFDENIILNKNPYEDNHVINKKYADDNYYGLPLMGKSEERWNRVAERVEMEYELKNPIEVTFKFTMTYANNSPYNSYCGISNVQFLNEDGTPWYLVAVSLISGSGTTWNKAWISKTMPTEEGWNYDWSKIRKISSTPSEQDLEFLNSFENILEVKARQSSYAGNDWYCGVTALHCSMSWLYNQYKIGALQYYRYGGTMEFFFDEEQTRKPCFNDIKAIRGLQAGFSQGSSNWTQGLPSYCYTSYTLNIERVIKTASGNTGSDIIFERPAWTKPDIRKCMFQIPAVPSVAFSKIKYKIPEGAPIDFATAVGFEFDEYNPFIYVPRNIKYPLPLGLVNRNENGQFYYTLAEYDALPEVQKMNNKLFIIVHDAGES